MCEASFGWAIADSLNESPSEKEGKSHGVAVKGSKKQGLNESPSEKEGKLPKGTLHNGAQYPASMKVPPKRKGNLKKAGITPLLILSPQ